MLYKNQYSNFSKKEVNFQGGYYGKVEAEHFKMQGLLFMYECMSYESDFHLRSCKQKGICGNPGGSGEVCWLWLLLQNVSRLCI